MSLHRILKSLQRRCSLLENTHSFLRRLQHYGVGSSQVMLMFYCATLQSIVRRRITAGFGKSNSEKQACHRAQNSYKGNGGKIEYEPLQSLDRQVARAQKQRPSTSPLLWIQTSAVRAKDFMCQSKNRTTWSYRLHRLQSSCWSPEPCSISTPSLQHSDYVHHHS